VEEMQAAYLGYVAFWGTYSIDRQLQRLTYRVTGSLFPNWVDHEQVRSYELDGGRLTLQTTPLLVQGQTVVGVLVWEKVV